MLSKELLEARERWKATEEERTAMEDARRCGGVCLSRPPLLLLLHLACRSAAFNTLPGPRCSCLKGGGGGGQGAC